MYGTEFRQFMTFRVLPFGSTEGTQQATYHFYYVSRGCAVVLAAKAIHDMSFMVIMTHVSMFIQLSGIFTDMFLNIF